MSYACFIDFAQKQTNPIRLLLFIPLNIHILERYFFHNQIMTL